ncbi:hypothetical protein HJC23_000162 [Cyclotella cryptica]|uniref:HSF-type DNA-binding domain-containing protein n=1 Tax=Cyclotella cryptica TaxID=29204 RepID=A0ABD3QCX2_9STRA|eukprot:CCRYP_006320-RA/>CCRYP_006320-RA protein AED:0.40 eAED:0.40 QI:0/-1/0/1/-1/1/1/0/562
MSLLEDHEAASLLAAGLSNLTHEFVAATTTAAQGPSAGSKRDRDISKARKYVDTDDEIDASTDLDLMHKAKKKPPPKINELDPTGMVYAQAVARPAPYFFYTDHSLEEDDDPFTPITAAGHVPCFPAKMHAILSNPELHHIVAWAPHGRSWRILKPRQFECYVLPRYFEHSKFSSFVRQANGWGFRRFAQGNDRNAYYQEYFLRSMPWLCKKMRRPKVGEKKAIGSGMEPDLNAISKEFPVPNNPVSREIQVVLETIKKGPRARMPVHWALDDLPPPRETRMIAPAAALTHEESKRVPTSNVMMYDNSCLARNEAFNPVQQPFVATFAQPSGLRDDHLRHFEVDVMDAPVKSMTSENRFNLNEIGHGQGDDFAAGFKAATQFHSDQFNALREALVRGASISSAFNALNRDVTPPVTLTKQGGTDDYLRFMQMQEIQDQMEEAVPNEMQLLQDQMQLMNHQMQTMRSQMRVMPNRDNFSRAGFRSCSDRHQGNKNEGNGQSSRVSDYLHVLQMDELSNQGILGDEPICRMHHSNIPSQFTSSCNVMSFEQPPGVCVSRMSRWP